jgi:23S rRNA pseudouridine1911/1915/1917 synthase
MGEGTIRTVDALVGPSEDGMRLDSFLSKIDGCPSRSACVRLIVSECVSINGTLAT